VDRPGRRPRLALPGLHDVPGDHQSREVAVNVSRGSDQLVTAARQNTREERIAASRLVLRRARDRDDLRQLLDALGLNESPPSTT
jgi:hypothetical protein